jgi:hypothetical protein
MTVYMIIVHAHYHNVHAIRGSSSTDASNLTSKLKQYYCHLLDPLSSLLCRSTFKKRGSKVYSGSLEPCKWLCKLFIQATHTLLMAYLWDIQLTFD